MDFLQKRSLKPVEDVLVDDFDSPICPGQNVPAQHHLGKAALANDFQELVIATEGLLVNRDVCKVMRQGDLLTTFTDDTNYAQQLC